MAIQKILCTETERETLVQNPCSLHSTKPVVSLSGQELSAISAKPTEVDIDENIKSETAMFYNEPIGRFSQFFVSKHDKNYQQVSNQTNKHDERVEDQETDFGCGRYLFIVTVKIADIVWTHIAEIWRKIHFFHCFSSNKGEFQLIDPCIYPYVLIFEANLYLSDKKLPSNGHYLKLNVLLMSI